LPLLGIKSSKIASTSSGNRIFHFTYNIQTDYWSQGGIWTGGHEAPIGAILKSPGGTMTLSAVMSGKFSSAPGSAADSAAGSALALVASRDGFASPVNFSSASQEDSVSRVSLVASQEDSVSRVSLVASQEDSVSHGKL